VVSRPSSVVNTDRDKDLFAEDKDQDLMAKDNNHQNLGNKTETEKVNES